MASVPVLDDTDEPESELLEAEPDDDSFEDDSFEDDGSFVDDSFESDEPLLDAFAADRESVL
ncbi:MAG: hypothetical protein ACRD2C_18445 [Acidimicrobiales bacterium]